MKVYNKRHDAPKGAVYVGRPTKWGNPFTHLDYGGGKYKVATREEAVAKYEEALLAKFARDPDAKRRLQRELRGKDLVCWCAPKACHADVLMKYANEDEA